MLVLVAMALTAVALVARLGVAADDAARARTAADAAALAGAIDGRRTAAEIAAANGGELLEFVRQGSVVEVVVGVNAARARARAETTVVWELPP
jgi:hypothetical protein